MGLKSAWELALERTGGKTTAKLSDEQKKKLSEIDRLYIAKIAEHELELKPKIAVARAAEKFEDAEKLEEILRAEIAKLRAKLEAEKEAIRQSK